MHSEIIQVVGIFGSRSCQNSTDFETACQQHGRFQANHFDIFILGDITAGFKFHIQLLSFTNFKCSQAEQFHHFFQMLRRTSCHVANRQNQHSISRKHGSVIVPNLVYGGLPPAHIRTVHQIIMQQCVVVINFDSYGRIVDRCYILTIQIIRHQHQDRTYPLPP